MQIPFFEIEFNKEAAQVKPQQAIDLKQAVTSQGVTDLIVLSHGWNNDMAEARGMYKNLLQHISTALASEPRHVDHKFLALNVLWPSKKFADKDLIAGGAAFITDDPERLRLVEEWKKMEPLLNEGGTQKAYKDILKDLSTSADKDRLLIHFTRLMKELSPAQDDPENQLSIGLSMEQVKTLLEDGHLDYLEPEANQGGAADLSDRQAESDTSAVNSIGNVDTGGNAGGANSLSGILDGIRNLMNLTTYYKMKNRAGKVGKDGLHPLLKEIKAAAGTVQIRIHLIGHSFGARLVTAALLGNDDQSLHVQSLSLLQAAFSHYSFAKDYQPGADGAFRNILVNKLIKGGFLITHTRADKAVGIAYAIASRIAGQVANAIGDKDSLYGGLGGNGAQKTPEKKELVLRNGLLHYGFKSDTLYNLLADGIITNHGDIEKPAVGSAIVEGFFV
jgi:hypothetical protein